MSHTTPDPLPGKAQVIDTAETSEEAWAKVREYVELLNDKHGRQRRWLISVIPLKPNVFWIKAEPATAKHLSDDS